VDELFTQLFETALRAPPPVPRVERSVNLGPLFEHVPAETPRARHLLLGKRLHLRDELRRIDRSSILSNVSKRPFRSFQPPPHCHDSPKPQTLLSGAAKTPHTKRLNPDRVRSDFAAQIEFRAARFVERFDLEGLADGTRESPLAGARHPRGRVGHADHANPIADLHVTPGDVDGRMTNRSLPARQNRPGASCGTL
jgi:hypothetical protein